MRRETGSASCGPRVAARCFVRAMDSVRIAWWPLRGTQGGGEAGAFAAPSLLTAPINSNSDGRQRCHASVTSTAAAAARDQSQPSWSRVHLQSMQCEVSLVCYIQNRMSVTVLKRQRLSPRPLAKTHRCRTSTHFWFLSLCYIFSLSEAASGRLSWQLKSCSPGATDLQAAAVQCLLPPASLSAFDGVQLAVLRRAFTLLCSRLSAATTRWRSRSVQMVALVNKMLRRASGHSSSRLLCVAASASGAST